MYIEQHNIYLNLDVSIYKKNMFVEPVRWVYIYEEKAQLNIYFNLDAPIYKTDKTNLEGHLFLMSIRWIVWRSRCPWQKNQQ